MKLSSWPEIGSDGDVLLMPYVPKAITGYDDDDCIQLHNLSSVTIKGEKWYVEHDYLYCI